MPDDAWHAPEEGRRVMVGGSGRSVETSRTNEVNGHANRSSRAAYRAWRGFGKPRRGLRSRSARPWRVGVRLLVALVVVLSALLPSPSALHAQRSAQLPEPPRGPDATTILSDRAPSQRSGPVRVMIQLTDEPAIVSATGGVGPRPGQVSASTFAAQVSRVDQAQRSVLQALNGGGIRTQVMYRVQKAYNGIATVVDAGDIARIKAQPGVKDIRVLRPKARRNASSVPLVNAPAAWASAPGLTGQGMRIGIIDSGVDYVHRNFGGSGNYAANTSVTAIGDSPDFPSAVVAGGYDFAGDAYDPESSNPSIFTPAPDPDPMDCNGHGSHVAGSAAGRGVTTGDVTFAGPYDASVPFASLKIGPGVAPAAQIYALKVFGCSGTTDLVSAAIDWALDPNGDNNPDDHLDVINMSLGASFGSIDDPDAVAANNAVLLGMIVVASAGNAGDTTAVVDSPSVASRAISVAASDDRLNRRDGFELSGPGILPASASAEFNWSSLPPSGIVAALQYDGPTSSGCTAVGSAHAGKISVFEWVPSGAAESPCGSATRTVNAFAGGAVGVILLYDQPYLDISIAGSAQIPTVIVDSNVASTVRSNLGSTARLDKALLTALPVVDASQEDKIASFTSRGPTTRNAGLKPDITAPGVSIFSTENGTGSDGVNSDGTSMAAPHVAGLMALLKQQHPTWTVEELKALAMNTATHDVFSGTNHGLPRIETSRTGVGRIDAATATTSALIAYETDEPGRVSVSFGALESLGTTSATRTVRLVNKGGSAIDVAVSFDPISQVPGATVSFPDGTSFSVPAGGTQTFRVQLSLNGAQLKNPRNPSMAATQVGNPRQYLAEVTGLVVMTPASGPVLRLPLHAAVRPASDMRASTSLLTRTPANTYTLGLTGTGVDNGDAPSVDITSLVTALELQAESPAQPDTATPEQKAGDLRYVGVASEGRVRGTVANSTLYFGVATEQNWLRPTAEVDFSILIDVNRDNTPDYELYNTEFVDGAGDSTDVMVTALYNVANNTTIAVSYLNVFNSMLPTAIFRNNVQILAVDVSDLVGLTLANSRFNYKVDVYVNGVVRDSTDVLTYDWLRPGLDSFTAPGQTPIFFDLPSTTMTLTHDPTSYQTNGSRGLLLLHHYNRDGQRAEVVRFGGTQTVSFAPGIPTVKTIGDPPFPVSAAADTGLPVTIASQTPAVCTIDGANVVTLVTPGTCTLRASQAGDATYLPASADLGILVSPAPTACAPRPNVAVNARRLAPGQLEVSVTAGSGLLQSIRFGTDTRPLANGTVQIDGQQITTGTTVPVTPSVASKTFLVTRVAAGQPMTIPMVVTDGCGAFETFVGVGAGG